MKPKCVTIETRATEQYVHVLLFIVLYKVLLFYIKLDYYLSNRPQVSMVYRLINHVGCRTGEEFVNDALQAKTRDFSRHNKPKLIDQSERAH